MWREYSIDFIRILDVIEEMKIQFWFVAGSLAHAITTLHHTDHKYAGPEILSVEI